MSQCDGYRVLSMHNMLSDVVRVVMDPQLECREWSQLVITDSLAVHVHLVVSHASHKAEGLIDRYLDGEKVQRHV